MILLTILMNSTETLTIIVLKLKDLGMKILHVNNFDNSVH